jgi:indolepyruvate ferredoxin oxidoreductase beta subunit
MTDSTTNILIAGVGGQGILLASEIIAHACLKAGYDVKKSEVHGMAQRGGSVTSHVRFGKRVFSPLIPKGDADVLLAFEQLEALRWVGYLKPDGTVVVNDQRIAPITVTSGAASYPEGIIERLRSAASDVHLVDGLGIARRVRNSRVVNMALLGALSELVHLEESVWTEAIREKVPAKALEANLAAFRVGRDSTR